MRILHTNLSKMQPDCVYDRRLARMLIGVMVSLASAAFCQLIDALTDCQEPCFNLGLGGEL